MRTFLGILTAIVFVLAYVWLWRFPDELRDEGSKDAEHEPAAR